MLMGGGLFMVILVIAVVALFIGGGSIAGRAFWARGDQDAKERSALQLLEERFANGEIDARNSSGDGTSWPGAEPSGKGEHLPAGGGEQEGPAERAIRLVAGILLAPAALVPVEGLQGSVAGLGGGRGPLRPGSRRHRPVPPARPVRHQQRAGAPGAAAIDRSKQAA
jgi:hypothetical protein